jgi:uncharacterized membrane protein YeaQ/YmgE (transglycosylase-associated protein family)
MTLKTALVILLVGAVAGLISGLVSKSKGKGFNLVVHLLVGVIGAFHGRIIFGLIDVYASGMVGHVVFAGVGAVLFLYPLRFIRPS